MGDEENMDTEENLSDEGNLDDEESMEIEESTDAMAYAVTTSINNPQVISTVTPLNVYVALLGLPLFLVAICQICNNERLRLALFRLDLHFKPVSVGTRALPENEYKLVEASGSVRVDKGQCEDELIGVAAPHGAVYLRRKVEMYQWAEKLEYDDKKDTVSTRALKKWSTELLPSFKTFVNPKEFPYDSKSFTPELVKLGDFNL